MDLSSLIRETPQLTLRPLRPEDYAAFLSGFRACGPARNRFDDGQFDLSFLTEDWYAGLLARRQREAEADISDMLKDASANYEGDPEAMRLRTMHLAYESVKQSGGTLVIPSAFSEGFTDPDAAEALAKAAKQG